MENTIKINLEAYEKLGMLTTLSNNIVMSQEGLGTFLEKVGSLFLSKLELVKNTLGLSAKQSGQISNEYNAYIQDLIKVRPDMVWVVNNIEYMVVKQARVMAPVGIKVDLIKLADELEDAIKIIHDQVFKCLDNLDMTISSVLTDQAYRTQSKPLKIDNDAIVYGDRLYAILNKVTDTKKVEDTRLVKDLLPNISSMTKVYDSLIKSSEKTSIKVLNNINEMVDNIYVKTQTLESEMKEDYIISKTVLNKLATDLESNAKLVTVTMSTIYLYNQTVLCLINLVKKLALMK